MLLGIACAALLPVSYGVLPPLVDYFSELGGPESLFALGSDRLDRSIKRSLVVSTLVAITAVGVALGAVLSYHRSPIPQKRLLLSLLLIPLFIPETTQAVSLNFFLPLIGVPKGAAWVWISDVSYVLPFVAIVLLLRFSSLPEGITRASRDLGLSGRVHVGQVLFPLIWPAVVVAGLFAFVLAFNEYTRANYLASTEFYSVYLAGQLKGGGGPSVFLVAALMFLTGVVLIGTLGWIQLEGWQPVSLLSRSHKRAARGLKSSWNSMTAALRLPTLREVGSVLGTAVALMTLMVVANEYETNRRETQSRRADDAFLQFVRGLESERFAVRSAAIYRVPDLIRSGSPDPQALNPFEGLTRLFWRHQAPKIFPHHDYVLRLLLSVAQAPKQTNSESAMESQAFLRTLCRLGASGWYRADPIEAEFGEVGCLQWIWENAPVDSITRIPAFPLFRESDIRSMRLDRYILTRSDFSRATMQEVSFSEARLVQSDFDGARLSRVSFRDANLRKASFAGAELECVDFQGADVAEVDFSSALFVGASFAGVRNIDQSKGKSTWPVSDLAECMVGILSRED